VKNIPSKGPAEEERAEAESIESSILDFPPSFGEHRDEQNLQKGVSEPQSRKLVL
jgi:hypothetical protein